MIILDTNVVSELMNPSPNPTVLAWVDAQNDSSVWTTSVTAFEIEYGIRRLPDSKRRTQLEVGSRALMKTIFAERILDFDLQASKEAARLSATLSSSGITVEVRDAFISGIALSRGALVATRNVRHFHVPTVNPWQPSDA